MSAPVASPRVRQEWQNRIAAEYGSAAITQHFVLWLIQVGASPDLIDDGLAIVADELAHAQLSAEVYAAAGGTAPPAIDRRNLELPRRVDRTLEDDLLTAALRVFCLNETVAVPLFAHLRQGCTVDAARAALDRVLLDEVRHRDFGWDLLDWLIASGLVADLPTQVATWLPAMLADLDRNYGEASPTFAAGAALEPGERAWGLAPTTEYAELLSRTVERDFVPRFAARGIDAAAAWSARAMPAPA